MKKRQGRLFFSLATIMIVPLLALGIILVVIAQQSVSKAMSLEIQKALAGVARETVDLYSMTYPGEIRMEGDHFYMGETDLTDNYLLADRIKENTGADITVLYGDVRMISTITDENGERIVGTTISNRTVVDAVFTGNEYYSSKTQVWDGDDYYVYYVPLYNGDEVCGMVFAGMTNESVIASIKTIEIKIVLVFLIVFLILLGIISSYAQNLVGRLDEIRDYIGGLTKNDFDDQMPQRVLNRKDEIGEMGRHAQKVGKTLQKLISNDPLTGLFNRRAGRAELAKCIDRASGTNSEYVTVALGDIDFFKTVNDRYGHECGDLVLVTVAEMFTEHIKEQGCAIRWGGEEFLLIYQKDEKDALAELETLQKELEDYIFEYEEHRFRVTMTFGLVQYMPGQTIDELVKAADDLLYLGKEGGRNRIIFREEQEN